MVEPTPLINMSLSVGMMTFPIYIYMEKYKMIQTTKQYLYNGVNTIIPYYTILYGVDIDYDIMGIAGVKYYTTPYSMVL